MAEQRARSPWDLLLIVAGLAMAAGPFLPFVSAASGLGSISRNGIDMVGAETFILVAFGLGIAYLGYARMTGPAPTGFAVWAPLIGGIVGLLLSLNYLRQIQGRVTDSELVIVSVGVGLWLCLGGSVGAIVGGLFGRRTDHSTDPIGEGGGVGYGDSITSGESLVESPTSGRRWNGLHPLVVLALIVAVIALFAIFRP